MAQKGSDPDIEGAQVAEEMQRLNAENNYFRQRVVVLNARIRKTERERDELRALLPAESKEDDPDVDPNPEE